MAIATDRVNAGWHRVRTGFWPILQACGAAALAYQVSAVVFGHDRPIFAAIAAWIALGFTFDRDLRRMVEIGVGVTLGVALGDVVVRLIGFGWWQLSAVLFTSAIMARFIDSGPLLATQAGAQAIVIAGTPILTGGPYGRALDAVVGGVVALAVALLTPHDPRKAGRRNASRNATALSRTAAMLADGLDASDVSQMAAALEFARSAEKQMDDALAQVNMARTRNRLTINRRHLGELATIEAQDILMARAMLSLRVLARRLRFDALAAPPSQRRYMADLLRAYASAAASLAVSITTTTGQLESDTPPHAEAQTQLMALAKGLERYAPNQDPAEAAADWISDWGVRTGLLLFRAVISDTYQASGATQAEAYQLLGVK